MARVSGTKLTTQEVAMSTHNEKTNVERKATVNKSTEQAAVLMVDKSTISHLHSSFQGLMKARDGLDLLPSLYTKLLS